VTVDRFEDEVIAELLVDLHDDCEVRAARGLAARAFVENNHAMHNAVDGYRQAVLRAYGQALPPIAPGPIAEPAPELSPARSAGRPAPLHLGKHETEVADAVAALGVATHDATIVRLASAQVELGLDYRSYARGEDDLMDDTPPISQELLDILACPVCKTAVRLDGNELVCDSCGRRYAIEDGIPIMLVEDQE
jgi:uncharacterized protein YbaR (Trm112 family)